MTAPTPEKATPIPALLPCPFCGEAVRIRRKSGTKGSTPGTRSRFYRERVHCEKCGASGPEGKAPNVSVARWNRIARAIMQDRAAREARPSLPDSREERIREDEWVEFNRGYLIAVANVMNMHKDAVIAVELLVQLGVTIDEAEGLDLTEYDMDALKRLRSEPRAAPFFKRKRRVRARQGGNNG